MKNIWFDTVSYIVELLKIFLVSYYFLKIKIKNIHKLIFTMIISIGIIIVGSIQIVLSEITMIFGIVAIITLFISMSEKEEIGKVVVAYVTICVVDMVLATAIMLLFDIDTIKVMKMEMLRIAINLISLIFISVVVLFKCIKKDVSEKYSLSRKDMMLYIVGCVSISFFIAAIQFLKIGSTTGYYDKIAVMGLSMSGLVYVVTCILLMKTRKQNERLAVESVINREMMVLQREYYMSLLQKEEQTKSFRHDIKEQFYCMNILLENKEYSKLRDYFIKFNEKLSEIEIRISTGNKLVDVILGGICETYKEVEVNWNGKVPEELSIDMMNVCTIFSNILRNAFEAANKCQEKKVDVSIKIMENNMLFVTMNTYCVEPQIKNGNFVSSKEEKNHGYGINNIKKSVEKYGGIYENSYEKGRFTTEIVLFNVISN